MEIYTISVFIAAGVVGAILGHFVDKLYPELKNKLF